MGNQSSYSWNRVQDLVGAIDPAGHSRSYLVDGFHHVTQQNDPAGKSTLYRYDANGDLTKITDPRSKGTIYTRNGFGDVVSRVSPDTGTTTFTYDSAGNVLTRKDAKGQILTYHYDALNRVTDVSASTDPNSVTTFSYDETLNGKGHLTSISEPSGNSAFDYNNDGLLSTAVWTPGNTSYQTRYSYDAAGRLTALTYPSGLTVHYARDNDGQVTGIAVIHPRSFITTTILMADSNRKRSFGHRISGIPLGHIPCDVAFH